MSTSRTAPPPERTVRVHLRTVLSLTGALLAVFVLLWLLWQTRQIIVWLAIAIFLAVALDPLVRWFESRGVPSRPLAVLSAVLVVLAALAGIGWLIVPTLVDQIEELRTAIPGYVDDITGGQGPLGFLERDYQIVERVRERLEGGGSEAITGTAVSAATGVLNAVIAALTIGVMVIFLLLGGPRWVEAFYDAVPPSSRPRYRRLGAALYRSIGGYVRGNLGISVIAGISAGAVLLVLGVPYAIALSLVIAIFDLIPLVGATFGAAIVGVVALSHSVTAAIVWLVFVIVYQQVENHLIQPVVYGRTVQLPAFAVLLAVLVGAKLGGVVGALFAIPVASTIEIVVMDVLAHRRAVRDAVRAEPL